MVYLVQNYKKLIERLWCRPPFSCNLKALWLIYPQNDRKVVRKWVIEGHMTRVAFGTFKIPVIGYFYGTFIKM